MLNKNLAFLFCFYSLQELEIIVALSSLGSFTIEFLGCEQMDGVQQNIANSECRGPVCSSKKTMHTLEISVSKVVVDVFGVGSCTQE